MTHMGHAFASTCAAIISRSAGDAHADALALRCRSIRWARRCGWRSKRPWCAALLYRRGWFCLLSRCMHTRKVHVLVFVAHRPCILILFRLISEESYELVSSPVLSNRTSNSTTVRIMTPSVYRSALRWTLCDRSSFGVGTERSCRPGHGPSCSSPWRRTRPRASPGRASCRACHQQRRGLGRGPTCPSGRRSPRRRGILPTYAWGTRSAWTSALMRTCSSPLWRSAG